MLGKTVVLVKKVNITFWPPSETHLRVFSLNSRVVFVFAFVLVFVRRDQVHRPLILLAVTESVFTSVKCVGIHSDPINPILLLLHEQASEQNIHTALSIIFTQIKCATSVQSLKKLSYM